MTKYSIIMPTYNVSAYLETAVNCILAQTITDFELIIVDDCATDGSGEIADRLEGCDERITVLHFTENQGVSAARNAGMKMAVGEYILFLDPDDSYEANLLELIDAAVEKDAPDIVVYSLNEDYYDEDGSLSYTKTHERPSAAYTDADKLHKEIQYLEQETMYGYPWNKAYKLSFLREYKVEYPLITHVEDILFNIAAFEHAKTVTVLSDKPYHYRNASQVRLTGKYLPNYLELQKTRIQAFLEQQERWGSLDDEGLQIMSRFYFRSFLSSIEREINHGSEDKAIRLKANEELKSDLFARLKDHLGSGRAIALLYRPLSKGNVNAAIRRARMIHDVKTTHPDMYAKLKQAR